MAQPDNASIIRDGLWNNNQVLVALIGMCPTLAITTNAVNGLGMGIAATAVLIGSNVTVSLVRNFVPSDVRLPVFVLIIASFVTAVDLSMQAWFYDLYKILGIFIPLIVVNCIIIGRAEAFASKHGVGASLLDGLATGLGFTLALFLLGGMRELAGQGTLLSQAHLMFGEGARGLVLTLGEGFHGMLVAILPPGAFIGLGLLIALRNLIEDRTRRRATQLTAAATQPATPAH